jgi:predicted transcriptional regulator
MPKKTRDGLTISELSILQLLWKEERALSRPEILENLPTLDFTPASIHAVLNSMIDKGVLEVEGLVRCGKIYGRTYRPTMTQEDYTAAQIVKLTPNLTQHKRITGIFAALVNYKGIDLETIEELEAMLKEKRKELDQ